MANKNNSKRTRKAADLASVWGLCFHEMSPWRAYGYAQQTRSCSKCVYMQFRNTLGDKVYNGN